MGIDAVSRRFREASRGLPYRPSATPGLLERHGLYARLHALQTAPVGS